MGMAKKLQGQIQGYIYIDFISIDGTINANEKDKKGNR